MKFAAGIVCLFGLVNAQSYSQSPSPAASYGSPSPSPAGYGPSPSAGYGGMSPSASPSSSASQTFTLSNVNFPTLQLPTWVGSASYGNTGTGALPTVTATTAAPAAGGAAAVVSGINVLATLPNVPTAGWIGEVATNGFGRDTIRDAWYDHSQYIPINRYLTSSESGGFGNLDLSNPLSVANAHYWGPMAYRIALWGDEATNVVAGTATQATTVAPAATTAASASGLNVQGANVYYLAPAGNIQGMGYPGLGLPVYGTGPQNTLNPGLNLAYTVNQAPSPAAPAPAPAPAPSMGGSSMGYGSSQSYSAPAPSQSYSAPAPSQSYSAPSAPAPSQSYSAPAPSQSYSAPAPAPAAGRY